MYDFFKTAGFDVYTVLKNAKTESVCDLYDDYVCDNVNTFFLFFLITHKK